VAGAAQRKTRSGLLHQGSIQRENLNGEFITIFSNLLSNQFVISEIELDILVASEELATTKYATDAWLYRR
jgi:lipoate-protein ligase A